jgi:hypothetical protein
MTYDREGLHQPIDSVETDCICINVIIILSPTKYDHSE